MKSLLLSFLWAGVVHSAIYPNGTEAVEPVTEEDASPIGDPTTYYPDQHDCPLPCKDYANVHSWITYFSVDRLRRCDNAMLLQLSVSQPLDNANSTVLIRGCTLEAPNEHIVAATGVKAVENPKKDGNLVLPGLESAPACNSGGARTHGHVQVAMSGVGNASRVYAGDAGSLLEGMRIFFNAEDNCDETFLFAQHRQTVAAVYVGDAIGKATVDSALQALAQRTSTNATKASRTVAELCGSGRTSERSFGVVVDTTGDLARVQKTALAWSEGKCEALGAAEPLAGAVV